MNRDEFEEICNHIPDIIEEKTERKAPLSFLVAWAIFQTELTDYLFSGSDEITIEPDKEV